MTWPKEYNKKDKYNEKDKDNDNWRTPSKINPRDLWPLRHWLHFWQLRTTILTIILWLLNAGWWWQHSQFLQCFPNLDSKRDWSVFSAQRFLLSFYFFLVCSVLVCLVLFCERQGQMRYSGKKDLSRWCESERQEASQHFVAAKPPPRILL